MSRLKLSTIIPTYNRPSDLEECLRSLFEMEQPPDEVIVVDGSFTDGTHELVRQFPVKYLRVRGKSMVEARNVGLRHAIGDIVAYVDDDIIVDKNWSFHILKPYEDEGVGGVGGRVLSYGVNKEVCILVGGHEIGKILEDGMVLGNFDIPVSTPIEVDTLIGCNMSFRRDLLIRIGGFDEVFRGNCFREDTDVCIRLRQLGYKLIYNSKALVWHKFRGKHVKLSWYYWTTYNQTYFYFKNFRPVTLKRLFRFLRAISPFHPYYSYIRRSGVKIKLNPLTATYALLGLITAMHTLRRTSP